MKRFLLAAAAVAALSLPARTQEIETTRTREVEALKEAAAAKDAKIRELQKQLEKAEQDKSLSRTELQYSRQQAVQLAADLHRLEIQQVELARERKILEELQKNAGAKEPATPRDQDDRRIVAKLLELCYRAFEEKAFDRCVSNCDQLLLMDPHYTVARELREDAQKVAEKPELYDVLAKKVAQWKKLTNSATGEIPYPATLKIQDPWTPAPTLSADEHYRRAEQDFQKADYDRAEQECRKAIARDPNHLPARTLLQELQFLLAARAPKAVRTAKVTAVSPQIGLVVLSLGKDGGVAEGDEFTVYRDGDFVAKIKIDRADRMWSAGKVVLKKSDPKVGDDVSNAIFVSVPRAETPALSKSSADELRALRKELDDVRTQVRTLSDRLVPSWQGAGVAVEDAPEELKTHLGLARGLIVRRVRPGSAAEKAGLLPNDVLPDATEAQLVQSLEGGTALKVVRRGQPLTLPGAKGR
jgi:tetratricopeptide (TPR) repeat protein